MRKECAGVSGEHAVMTPTKPTTNTREAFISRTHTAQQEERNLFSVRTFRSLRFRDLQESKGGESNDLKEE
jgi:hypothetical protein